MEATFAEYEEWSEQGVAETVSHQYKKALQQLEKYKALEESLVTDVGQCLWLNHCLLRWGYTEQVEIFITETVMAVVFALYRPPAPVGCVFIDAWDTRSQSYQELADHRCLPTLLKYVFNFPKGVIQRDK